MRRPIRFVPNTDPAAAMVFKEEHLGLYLLENSAFAQVFREGDSTLRVQIEWDLAPVSHTIHDRQFRILPRKSVI